MYIADQRSNCIWGLIFFVCFFAWVFCRAFFLLLLLLLVGFGGFFGCWGFFCLATLKTIKNY